MHPTRDVTLTGTEPDKVPAFIQVRIDITLRKYGCCTSKAVWGSKHSWGLSKWMSTSFVVQRNLTSALAFWTTDSNFAYLHPKLSCPLTLNSSYFQSGAVRMSPLVEAARATCQLLSHRDEWEGHWPKHIPVHRQASSPLAYAGTQVLAKEANTFHCSNQHWLLPETLYSVDLY